MNENENITNVMNENEKTTNMKTDKHYEYERGHYKGYNWKWNCIKRYQTENIIKWIAWQIEKRVKVMNMNENTAKVINVNENTTNLINKNLEHNK